MKSLLLFTLCSLGGTANADANDSVANPVVVEKPVVILAADTIVTTDLVVVRLPVQEERQPADESITPQVILDWSTPLDSTILHYPFLLINKEKR